jgi:hypothetical protein
LKQLAWQQKQRLIRTLNRFLPERPAALLSAILLGDRSRLTLMDQALLRKAGLSHLTAVSGACRLADLAAAVTFAAMFHNRLIRRLILCLVLTGFRCPDRMAVIGQPGYSDAGTDSGSQLERTSGRPVEQPERSGSADHVAAAGRRFADRILAIGRRDPGADYSCPTPG